MTLAMAFLLLTTTTTTAAAPAPHWQNSLEYTVSIVAPPPDAPSPLYAPVVDRVARLVRPSTVPPNEPCRAYTGPRSGRFAVTGRSGHPNHQIPPRRPGLRESRGTGRVRGPRDSRGERDRDNDPRRSRSNHANSRTLATSTRDRGRFPTRPCPVCRLKWLCIPSGLANTSLVVVVALLAR